MKLWRIPNEWDYHQLGAVFVVAPTKEAAIRKAKRRQKALTTDGGPQEHTAEYAGGSASAPYWDGIEEIKSGAFFQDGCDD